MPHSQQPTDPRHRGRRAARPMLTAGAALTLTLGVAGPSFAGSPIPIPRPQAGADSATFPSAQVPLGDHDARGAIQAPLAAAVAEVAAMGKDVSTSWTQYGTPQTMLRDNGWLATGLAGSPAEAARSFLSTHHALFGLSTGEIGALELWRDDTLESSDAHAVLFRQHVGGMPLAEDGLITVAIRGGDVAGLTSSAVPSTTLNTTVATLSPAAAVLAAAHDAGITGLALSDLRTTATRDAAGFTHVLASTLPQAQRTQLVALPMTTGPAHLAYLTDIEDVAGLEATAATTYVDAASGAILLRHDAVQTADDASAGTAAERTVSLPDSDAISRAAFAAPAGSFSGTYPKNTPMVAAASCSAPYTLSLDAGSTQAAVTVTASGAANASDDITLTLHSSKAGRTDVTSDTLFSPQEATYTFSPAFAAGEVFTATLCSTDASGAANSGGAFTGTYTTTSSAVPVVGGVPVASGVNAPAKFKFFQDSPVLGSATVGLPAADNRATACGPAATVAADPAKNTADVCTIPLQTPALPDAFDLQNGAPTLQTIGNNAVTTNAQDSSSLTPGAPATTYQSATRDYTPAFSDSWKSSLCNPTSLAGTTMADVNTGLVNLFTGHNRIHDFAFRLGLNDTTGSMQTVNTTTDGMGGDPELGNVQNAANTNAAIVVAGTTTPTTGEAIPVTGRNNANQITMQDGVPGITNQYLFQPVLGFYGPCADGDLDSSIFLHEYTHAISNRLIAGPATGLSGQQGGSMGESWSDLDAIEFLNAFGVAGKQGENRYAEGAYATGDKARGIRDYNLLDNPLTYGEFGFDTTGPEVHADGEIWNGIQMHVRQALIDLYAAKGLPDSNAALEKACAFGVDASGNAAPSFDGCPGDRRWITYLYDSLILQSNGAPTFVDMKKTTLMSVMLRNAAGTASEDYKTVAEAFAQRGLGTNSSSTSSADTDPVAGFAAPIAADNAPVTFSVTDADTGSPLAAKVYVGTYSARASVFTSTVAATGLSPAQPIVAGTETFVVQAPGYGITRVPATTFTGGKAQTVVVKLSRNFASVTSGAVPAAGPNRPADAFDDSEATNAGYNSGTFVGKVYNVALKGSHQLQVFNVSAMHHVVSTAATDFQSRITDLRAFHLQVSSDGGVTYRTVYTSPADFFPGKAPRTVAPDVALRTITLPAPVMADHLQLVVDSTQCTGAPDFATDADNDPLNSAACPGTTTAPMVNVADIEAFGPSAVSAVTPPAATLPEVGTAAALPLAGLLLLGAVAYRRRRRQA